jgi:hypothetical protein
MNDIFKVPIYEINTIIEEKRSKLKLSIFKKDNKKRPKRKDKTTNKTPARKAHFVNFKYKDFALPLSPFAKNSPPTAIIVGETLPTGTARRDIKEIKLISVPYSLTSKFLLIRRLNKKLKILPTIPPAKIMKDPEIKGCLIKVCSFLFIL